MKFNLIVAMCNSRGIGYKGHLPWPVLKFVFKNLKGNCHFIIIFYLFTFRKDMAFLAKISTETRDQSKKN